MIGFIQSGGQGYADRYSYAPDIGIAIAISWAVADLFGARALRALGQAFVGRGDLKSARECLEQLRTIQKEQSLLSRPDYAAALSDLFRCYRGLGLAELAQACQDEAKRLL